MASLPRRAPPGGPRPFRVRAEDADDLRLASAYLQDAIVPLSEMAYAREANRFVLVAQRFRWELAGPAEVGKTPAAEPPFARVHCGIRFEAVRAVQTHGLSGDERPQMLNLLAIHAAEGTIELAFSGDVSVRLSIDRIHCQFEDMGEPWPSFSRPAHDDAPPDEAAGAI